MQNDPNAVFFEKITFEFSVLIFVLVLLSILLPKVQVAPYLDSIPKGCLGCFRLIGTDPRLGA